MQTDLFKKIAILIEQNPVETVLYSDTLAANGFEVFVTSSPMEAFVKLREEEVDLILIDIANSSQNFVDKFIKNIRKEKKCEFTTIIGLSLYSAIDEKNMYLGMDMCLTKPCSIDMLIESVFSCIENKRNGGECINC